MAILLSLLLISVFVSGCGGGGGGGGGSSVDYSGLYSGQIFNRANDAIGGVSMRVTSSGNAVATVALGGEEVDLPGTLNKSNGDFRCSLSSSDVRLTLDGKATRNAASGTFTVVLNGNSASGPFRMTKISSGSSALTAPAPQTQTPQTSKALADALKKSFELD